jgi:CheY-like chemotaxis protein
MSDRRRKNSKTDTTDTILIVDPDVLVRMVVAEYLRECGYKVIEALNGDEVLVILNAGIKVDTLFSEVALPGSLDGFALAQKLRSDFPGIEVVLASGLSIRAKKSGELCNEGPIRKPHDPARLGQRLRRVIEERRVRNKATRPELS